VTLALYPGSFDPFHNGHLEIVERAARIFDEVVVAALRNPQKSQARFDLDARRRMIEESISHLDNVRFVAMSKLVVEVAEEIGATVIVRGLRVVSDFESELQMAQMNRELSGIETVFIPTSSSHSFLASRLLSEVATYGGDISPFVPKPVAAIIEQQLRRAGGPEEGS
jgi:pantetheine-phosphate adenylyltransferase